MENEERTMMGKGTAIVSIIGSTLGGGCLSLPYALSHSGIILGISSIVAVAFITYVSCNLLVLVAMMHQGNSLESVTELWLGQRGNYLSAFLVTALTWVAAVAYLMMISENILEIFPFPKDEDDEITHRWNRFVVVICVGMSVLPLSLLRRLNALRYTSTISIGLITTLILLIGIRSFEKGVVFDDVTDRSPIKYWPSSVDDITVAVPLIMGAYLCQFQVIPVLAEISDPEQMPKVIRTSIGMVTALYIFIALVGYYYALDETCDTVLHTFGSHDPYAQIARSMMTVALFFSFPLNMVPCRATLVRFLISQGYIQYDSEDLPVKEHVQFTLFILFTMIFTAALLPTIGLVWGILGSTLSVFIAFILPPLLYLNLIDGPNRSAGLVHLSKFMIVLGIFFGVAGLTSTLVHSSDPSCPETTSNNHTFSLLDKQNSKIAFD